MRQSKPANWRELKEDYIKTFVTAERFKKLISKDGYFFVTESYPYPNRFIRIKETDKVIPSWELLRKRTHNIDVNEEERTISYEGNDSMWHEVLGTDADFDELYAILKSKVRELN